MNYNNGLYGSYEYNSGINIMGVIYYFLMKFKVYLIWGNIYLVL